MRSSFFGHALMVMILFFLFYPAHFSAAYYPSPIEYISTLKVILEETQVIGGEDPWDSTIDDIEVSSDGSAVAFIVDFSSSRKEIWLMNPDGSGLQDISSYYPVDVDYGDRLQINADGSLVFFIGKPGPTDYMDIYYYDSTPPKSCDIAAEGIKRWNNIRPFGINGDGDTIFFREDLGWDGDEYHRGLFSTTFGGPFVKVLDWSELPCDVSNCGILWFNNLYFLGNSANGQKLIFRWDSGGWNAHTQSMWYTDPVGNYTRSPNETHTNVWDVGWNLLPLVSSNGEKGLFVAQDAVNNDKFIAVVDFLTNQKTIIATSPNVLRYPTLSPDGTHVRFESAHYYRTVADVSSGTMRDSGSGHIGTYSAILTGLTSDNRFYYYSYEKSQDDIDRIYQVDLTPSDFYPAPEIEEIAFSATSLLHDGVTTITVYASISDPQGLESVQSVLMNTVVDGLEDPDWRFENSEWSTLRCLT